MTAIQWGEVKWMLGKPSATPFAPRTITVQADTAFVLIYSMRPLPKAHAPLKNTAFPEAEIVFCSQTHMTLN